MADNKTTIARPYAKAAFAVGQGTGNLGAWSEALRTGAAVVGDPGVQRLLGDPGITPAQLTEFVADLSAGSVAPHGRNFIATLAQNRRLDVLPEISALFDALKDEAEGIADVTVTSAVPLDAQHSQAIGDAMARRLGRRVRLHAEVDPSLLGGAVVRAGDLIIDGSVRTRLQRIARDITA